MFIMKQKSKIVPENVSFSNFITTSGDTVIKRQYLIQKSQYRILISGSGSRVSTIDDRRFFKLTKYKW